MSMISACRFCSAVDTKYENGSFNPVSTEPVFGQDPVEIILQLITVSLSWVESFQAPGVFESLAMNACLMAGL